MEIIIFAIMIFSVLGFQALIYRLYMFKGVEYSCCFDRQQVYEGDEVYLVETLCNRKLLPLPWVKITISIPVWLELGGQGITVTQDKRFLTSTFYIKGYQKITRKWKVTCTKRGFYIIERGSLVAGDLFGIYRNSIPLRINPYITVYPRAIQLEDILISVRSLLGDTIVRRWIIDDPFVLSGVREYAYGDAMNKIHWKASAKTGRLMSVKTDFTSQYSMTIILNIESMEVEYHGVVHKNIPELGIKVACALLDNAARTLMATRLISNGVVGDNPEKVVFTAEGFGREHVAELFTTLAKLEIKRLMYFDELLGIACRRISHTQAIIITPYVNENMVDKIKALKAQDNAVKIIMLDYTPIPEIPSDVDVYYVTGYYATRGG